MKYNVSINFYGTADFSVEADTEDEAIDIVKNSNLLDCEGELDYAYGDEISCESDEEEND